MKTRLVLTMALCPWLTQAQVSFTNTPIASLDTPPVVVETGPHHRVWQRVVSDELGRFLTNSFTELATGLNYFNPATGTWEESLPQFQITKDGYALADKIQHKLIVSANLNTAVAVDLQSPEHRFQNHVLGLSYFDPVSGKSALLAEVMVVVATDDMDCFAPARSRRHRPGRDRETLVDCRLAGQRAVKPPSTLRIVPVMPLAASEARNTMASAISPAVRIRPIGWLLIARARLPAGSGSAAASRALAMKSVSTAPGATALTRMPRCACPTASWRVSCTSAPFVIE